jgi:subtilisin family serine protease
LFRDRGTSASVDSALAAAARTLSPRAIARREKAARERGQSKPAVDVRDLEPNAPYVVAVEAAGARIRTTSRWLNAVSIDAEPEALAAIRNLPFVSDVRPVAVVAQEETDAPGMDSPGGTSSGLGADEFWYGPAEHQLTMLGIPEAHAMGYHGEGVLVCVLDSGFELEHEAFDQLEVRATRDFLFHDENVAYDPKQDIISQSNHGTQVLSILAGFSPGHLVGPAYRADFILGKTEYLPSETKAEEDAWIEGVEWAEAMGADIVTSSLSYSKWYRPQDEDGRTALITQAANLAFERGVLVFNSIGNLGPDERTLSPPSDSPDVIAVGATNWNGRLTGFSSLGPTWDGRVKPDLVAMGSGVPHVIPRSRDRYGSGAGTSYSTPLVAGCAAIVLSAHPDWGPEMVRDALVMSGDRAGSPGNRYGWGIPNVRDAIYYPFVDGRVTDGQTREAVARATVAWEPAGAVDSLAAAPGDSPPRGSVVTDSTGAYVVPNLPSGTYRVRVSAEGYADVVSEPLEVPPSLGDVNFALERRP